MAGVVLCTLNVRHDSKMVSTLLKHSSAKGAIEIMLKLTATVPQIVLIPDSSKPPALQKTGVIEYEALLAMGSLDFEIRRPNDECEPITLNYTSGTTSSPKGVVYSHRGAYLNSLAAVLLYEMRSMSVYLWVVPMFHCNGWCLTWGVAAQGGTNVCLRVVTAKGIFESISRHQVTHMGAASTVLNTIINAPGVEQLPLLGKVTVLTGGDPPPSMCVTCMVSLRRTVREP
ncbi:hypothetical protein L1987_13770 [Smallanthus sonchifolius]|uniref:Uncharacterized protein n=1 Tax=Smallanthus sonchifolius TaxID=185202 RepID=A0ACB9JIG3_9ASTR|nr:hypothetical protein L1987_13770 [Smallanthus sonchifolius]